MELGKPLKIRIGDLRTDEMVRYIYDSTDNFFYESAVREIYETVNRLVWI